MESSSNPNPGPDNKEQHVPMQHQADYNPPIRFSELDGETVIEPILATPEESKAFVDSLPPITFGDLFKVFFPSLNQERQAKKAQEDK